MTEKKQMIGALTSQKHPAFGGCKCVLCLEAWANSPHTWKIDEDTTGPFTHGEIEAYWRRKILRGGTARTPQALPMVKSQRAPFILRLVEKLCSARRPSTT